jgi:hypothetical protein
MGDRQQSFVFLCRRRLGEDAARSRRPLPYLFKHF